MEHKRVRDQPKILLDLAVDLVDQRLGRGTANRRDIFHTCLFSFLCSRREAMTPLCIPTRNATVYHRFLSAPANGSVSSSLHPLESEALIKSERQEACLYQPVLKWSSSEGREDLSLLHLLRFDKSKIIDPQLSTWSQHTIEISEGLL